MTAGLPPLEPAEPLTNAVEVALGVAMVCACLFHMRSYLGVIAPGLPKLALTVGYLATPGYLLLGGLLCGRRLALDATSETARRIVDIGVFLLTVGHLVISATSILARPHPADFWKVILTTDLLGLCLCLSWWLRTMTATRLVAVGGALLLASWIGTYTWQPQSPVEGAVAAMLIGLQFCNFDHPAMVLALCPFLGIFVTALGLGRCSISTTDSGRGIQQRLLLTGACVLAAAGAVHMARNALHPVFNTVLPDRYSVSLAMGAIDIRQKYPPSPAYVLFYCGAAAAICGLVAAVGSRSRRVVGYLAVTGRASFAAYLIQLVLLFFVPQATGMDTLIRNHAPVSVLYLIATLVMVVAGAQLWDRRGWNRWLTVGISAKPVLENARGVR